MNTQLTPGIYQLALDDGTQQSVRVAELNGQLRWWLVDAVGIKCSGCESQVVTDDMKLSRSPEQEKTDLVHALSTSHSDVAQQLNRLAEIAKGYYEHRWDGVRKLRLLDLRINQLIEELD